MSGKAKILGLGSYLPKRILSNQDLEKMVDTSDEWIITRTGMKERRLAAQILLKSQRPPQSHHSWPTGPIAW